MLTTDPKNPDLGKGGDTGKVPQNKAYLVLSEEERAKGFVRPVRTSYEHVGKLVENVEGSTIRKLTSKEKKEWERDKYVAEMMYPKSRYPAVGRYLTQDELDNIGKYIGGCGSVTTMAQAIAETYARSPSFYGFTYCCVCEKHLPVDEFVWVGTDEKVGS